MKNFSKLLFVSIVAIIFLIASSCSKDEQPRYVKVEILENTGKKIVEAENEINKDRATSDPSKYDSLATHWTEQVKIVLQEEITWAIDQVVGAYDKEWRENPPKHQKKVWVRIDVGCNIEVYRVCTDYSEKLLRKLHHYCESVVNGGIEWASGERIPWIEDEIKNLFVFDPDESPNTFWQYEGRLHDYFLRYAQNPNAKAEYKNNGFLNIGWGQ